MTRPATYASCGSGTCQRPAITTLVPTQAGMVAVCDRHRMGGEPMRDDALANVLAGTDMAARVERAYTDDVVAAAHRLARAANAALMTTTLPGAIADEMDTAVEALLRLTGPWKDR